MSNFERMASILWAEAKLDLQEHNPESRPTGSQ